MTPSSIKSRLLVPLLNFAPPSFIPPMYPPHSLPFVKPPPPPHVNPKYRRVPIPFILSEPEFTKSSERFEPIMGDEEEQRHEWEGASKGRVVSQSTMQYAVLATLLPSLRSALSPSPLPKLRFLQPLINRTHDTPMA